jgi:hypothetical protein
MGVFFDDDGDPQTDGSIVAFWGETAADSGVFTWMQGNAQGFAPVADSDMELWERTPPTAKSSSRTC